MTAYENHKVNGKCLFQGTYDVRGGFPCVSSNDCQPGSVCKPFAPCAGNTAPVSRCIEKCVANGPYRYEVVGSLSDPRLALFMPKECTANSMVFTGQCHFTGNGDIPAGGGCDTDFNCQDGDTTVGRCVSSKCQLVCEFAQATLNSAGKCSYVGKADIPPGNQCMSNNNCVFLLTC